jgi:hypothetical protein
MVDPASGVVDSVRGTACACGPAGEHDAAVRRGLAAVAGLDVATPSATAELVEAASASGLTCAPADTLCWQRLGTLGGFDTVVVVMPDRVVVQAATVVQAERLEGPASVDNAVRRAFQAASAMVLTVDPPDATITFDGAPAGTIVDGVSPGSHRLEATAPGRAPAVLNVVLPAGLVTRQNVQLGVPTSSSSALPTAGVVTLGVGGALALAGIALGTVGEVAGGGACTSASDGICEVGRWGWIAAIGGGAVGLVGAGLFAIGSAD